MHPHQRKPIVRVYVSMRSTRRYFVATDTRLYLRLRTEFLVGQAFLCTADEPYLLTNRIADEPRSENNGSLQKQRA